MISYDDYVAERAQDRGLIPHDVISRTVEGATPLKAWREYLGLTQAVVAGRLGVTQSAYAQQEISDRLRRSSREKIAGAFGYY